MTMPSKVLEKVVGNPRCTTLYESAAEPQTPLRFTKFVLNMEATITRLQPCWDFEFKDMYEGKIIDQENCSIRVNQDTLEVNPFDDSAAAATRNAISEKLSSINVPAPVRKSMVDKILNDASFYAIVFTKPGANCKVLNLEVAIDVHVVDMYVWNDHVGEAGLEFVPRSKKLWIENKLERVRVAKVSTMCPICTKEMMVGSEGTRIPCSHVYHGACILKWLDVSRSCLLCRFSMLLRYEKGAA